MGNYTIEAVPAERIETPAKITVVLTLLEFAYALEQCRKMAAERRRWWSRLLWWRVSKDQRQIVECLELMHSAAEELHQMVETEWPQ